MSSGVPLPKWLRENEITGPTSWEPKGNLRGINNFHGNLRGTPQCHPPQKIRPYFSGLLTIGFP